MLFILLNPWTECSRLIFAIKKSHWLAGAKVKNVLRTLCGITVSKAHDFFL